MTTKQFAKSLRIAKELRQEHFPQSTLTQFDGCGLSDFKPIATTIEDVSQLIRYQALQLNGEFDADAVRECQEIAKRRFIVAD